MQIQLQLETAAIETGGFVATLEQLQIAVMLLDATGLMIHANAAAGDLLRAADGLTIRNGRVAAQSTGVRRPRAPDCRGSDDRHA